MRFIFSFILFGLLFYAISIFFPEAFATMVSWAAALFNGIAQFWERITHSNPN